MLDITSSDKGLLIPRVIVLDINTIGPITEGITESLLVYNTSTQLKIADNTRGILINRDSLSTTNNVSPVTSPATDLLVYNT